MPYDPSQIGQLLQIFGATMRDTGGAIGGYATNHLGDYEKQRAITEKQRKQDLAGQQLAQLFQQSPQQFPSPTGPGNPTPQIGTTGGMPDMKAIIPMIAKLAMSDPAAAQAAMEALKQMQPEKMTPYQQAQLAAPDPTIAPDGTVIDQRDPANLGKNFAKPAEAKVPTAPQTRTRHDGDKEIIEQFNPQTGGYDKVSEAPRWQPAGPEQTRGSQGGTFLIPGVGVRGSRFRNGEYEYMDDDSKWKTMPPGATPTSVQTFSPGQRFEQENKLRDEYQTLSKDYKTIKGAYATIKGVPESPAGDLSMLYSYVKLLDPNSVVRESEFATAETARPLMERLGLSFDAVSSVWQGKRMTPGSRADFLRSAQSIHDEAEKLQGDRDEQYTGLAGNYELDPKRVVTGIQSQKKEPTPKPSTPGGVAPAPAGAVSMLKQNPNLAAAFDAKYGPGASRQYLGQ